MKRTRENDKDTKTSKIRKVEKGPGQGPLSRRKTDKPNKKERSGEVSVLPTVLRSSDVKIKTEYMDHYSKLLKEELDNDIQEYEDRINKWSVDRLKKEGFTLFGLVGRTNGVLFDDTILRFEKKTTGELSYNRFTQGDIVNISKLGPRDPHVLEGVVLDKSKFHIEIVVKIPPQNLEEISWRIDKSANRLVHDRMMNALTQFTSNNPEITQDMRQWAQVVRIKNNFLPKAEEKSFLKTILLDKSNPNNPSIASQPSILSPLHKPEEIERIMKDWKLNSSQRDVILGVLNRRLSLVQGPPGTGKTHTAIHILRLLAMLYKNENIPILATAFTNVATDNLLEGLRDYGINALRIGRPVKVRPELRDATLQANLDRHPYSPHLYKLKQELRYLIEQSKNATGFAKDALIHKTNEKKKEIRTTETKIMAEIIRNAQVICCTCIGAGDLLLNGQYFPIVLIDESTQAVEPAMLVPLTKGAQQVILLGDHFQLPPTVRCNKALEGGLGESLFGTLAKIAKIEPFVLDLQYRMHPKLSQFPSSHFYDGKIKDAIKDSDRPIPFGFDWPNGCPITFIDCRGYEQSTDNRSKINKREGQIVVEIVRNFLLSKELARSDIGIITPYSGQVRYFYDQFKLDPLFLTGSEKDVQEVGEYADTQLEGGLNIASVDGFQGREKEVIIFSPVRSNDKGKVGFLSDWRRLNVAITRARRGLIIVGDKTTLMNDKHWAAWIMWVEAIGAIRNESEFLIPKGVGDNPVKNEGDTMTMDGDIKNENENDNDNGTKDIDMKIDNGDLQEVKIDEIKEDDNLIKIEENQRVSNEKTVDSPVNTL